MRMASRLTEIYITKRIAKAADHCWFLSSQPIRKYSYIKIKRWDRPSEGRPKIPLSLAVWRGRQIIINKTATRKFDTTIPAKFSFGNLSGNASSNPPQLLEGAKPCCRSQNIIFERFGFLNLKHHISFRWMKLRFTPFGTWPLRRVWFNSSRCCLN